jgi:hypothetical protein
MPTSFAECNENITCYAFIGIFQMLATEGCEHVPELRKHAHSYDASVLHDVMVGTGRIVKRLVKNWWNAHGLSYCMRKIEEENRVSFVVHCSQVTLSDEYITPMDTNNTSQVDIQGPITRARARQLNL